MKSTPRTAIVLTLLATLFWGANFSAGKLALSSLPPWTVSAERFVIAATTILLYLAVTKGIRWEVLRTNCVAFAILGIVGVAGFNGSLFVGLKTSSTITAALTMATTPLSASLMEAILTHRLPSAIRMIGAAISLIGVALVLTNGAIFSGGSTRLAAGDPLIVFGSLCWSAYTVGCRAYIRDSTPLETTTWTMVFGTLVLVGLALALEQPVTEIGAGSLAGHLAVLFMAIAGSVLAYLFWTIGVAVRGPAQTAMFFNFVPIFALLISVAQGSAPGMYRLVGIAITIAGVVIGSSSLSLNTAPSARA